jgi:hypothetical protein
MALPEVPGIIDASMTISQESDGRISFRVLIGADGGTSAHCDLIELIIGAEDINRALADANIGALVGSNVSHDQPTVPCHIGLHRDAGHAVA